MRFYRWQIRKTLFDTHFYTTLAAALETEQRLMVWAFLGIVNEGIDEGNDKPQTTIQRRCQPYE